MPRDQINEKNVKKLKQYFTMTLDKNFDGIINWEDFEASIERIVPIEISQKSGRLVVLRKRLEQNYREYFSDLCKMGDANKDGNVDFEEWLDVMNEIISQLKNKNDFPEWYEGLHKAIWRSCEFFNEKDVMKEEFVDMISIWDISNDKVESAYDFITENGKKRMDYNLFSEFMKRFLTNDDPSCAINMGLMD